MKLKYLRFEYIAVVLILLIFGCAQPGEKPEKNVTEELPSEVNKTEVNETLEEPPPVIGSGEQKITEEDIISLDDEIEKEIDALLKELASYS